MTLASMKSTYFKIEADREYEDVLSGVLAECGSTGAEIDYANNMVIFKAYFPEGGCIDKYHEDLIRKIRTAAERSKAAITAITQGSVEDEDWSNAWRKYYKPFHITDKIVIKPSWESYVQAPGETATKKVTKTVIELDPGMAFGTGTHESTAICARLIEKYISSGARMLDLGCGSGILSLVAVGCGASRVVAADIDGIAVRITKENAALNGAADKIDAKCGTIDSCIPALEKFDLVAANIIADVILELSIKIPLVAKNGGYCIVSGIIRDRRDEVIDRYVKAGFCLVEATELGEWVGIAFRWPGSI